MTKEPPAVGLATVVTINDCLSFTVTAGVELVTLLTVQVVWVELVQLVQVTVVPAGSEAKVRRTSVPEVMPVKVQG